MTIETQIRTLGFEETPYDLSDKRPSGLVYLYRAALSMPEGALALASMVTQHQYVSLCHYEGAFVEAVIEVFAVPRDPKARRAGTLRSQQLKGAAPLYVNLARDWETIEGMVGKVYAVAKND